MASEQPPEDKPGFFADLFQTRYREATLSAILFGLFFGAILNMSITYAGLKLGFTIGGSAIAAVLGFGVLRGLLGKGTILETNIAQTIASSVNIPNSGIIFTVPALILMGYSIRGENFWLLSLAGLVGATLGVGFIIPLRKQMIDIERLRFPSAVAVAAILKSPGAGPKKSLVLLFGAVVAALVYLPVALPSIEQHVDADELDELVARGKIKKKAADETRAILEWQETKELPAELAAKGKGLSEQLKASKLNKSELTRDDVLALTVYRLSSGSNDWDALDMFRAKRSRFPGYGDLNWRMPAEYDDAGKLTKRVDRDGDDQLDAVFLGNEMIDAGRILGMPDYMFFVLAISPLSFGAGYLTGRAGLMVLAGGILAFYVLTPIAYNLDWLPATVEAAGATKEARSVFNRPLGIGMLLGGALMGVVASLPAIRSAFKSIAFAGRSKTGGDELGLKVLAAVVGVSLVFLFVAAKYASPGEATGGLLEGLDPTFRNLLIAVIGAAWMWFAGIIIAQCTGMTDWSPISGMALITIVLVMFLAGRQDVVGAVLIGAALCVAISAASDMMADLKTGYLVGAQPRRQQILELFTSLLGPVICMATLLLIVEVNERNSFKPIGPGTPTEAPQAQALQAVIKGVQGGQMPYALYGFGAVLGILLGLGSFPGLGVLVGLSMYLPIEYVLPYGLGCIANMIVGRIKGRSWAEEWGVPFCAGLIVGEAILQMVINLIVLMVS